MKALPRARSSRCRPAAELLAAKATHGCRQADSPVARRPRGATAVVRASSVAATRKAPLEEDGDQLRTKEVEDKARELMSRAEEALFANSARNKHKGGVEYFQKVCGDLIINDEQQAVVQKLRSSMKKAGKTSLFMGLAYIISLIIEWLVMGTVKDVWTKLANFVHHVSLAFLIGITATSFDNIVYAAKKNENSLPYLMLALARLSVVLSQFSAMAMATGVITVVGAAKQCPGISLFISVGMAASMVLRMGSGLFLMTDFAGRGSLVSTITTLQANSTRTHWWKRIAVMTSASNLLHYPFAMTFAQAHAREEAKGGGHDPEQDRAILAAADKVLLDPDFETGLTQEGKHGAAASNDNGADGHVETACYGVSDGTQAGGTQADGTQADCASSNGVGQSQLEQNGSGTAETRNKIATHNGTGQRQHEQNGSGTAERRQASASNNGTGQGQHEQNGSGTAEQRHPSHSVDDIGRSDGGKARQPDEKSMDGEDLAAERLHSGDKTNDYEFNEGEELVLQVLCDEMRLAGYNNVHFAIAVALSALASLITGNYSGGLLAIPLVRDVAGTARALFTVTRQFETAVLSTGRDITVLLVGMGTDKGLGGLFDRISDLGKGVVIGQSVGVIYMLRGFISAAATTAFHWLMAFFVGAAA